MLSDIGQAVALHNQGRLADALRAYDAILLRRIDSQALLNRGSILYDMCRLPEAMQCYQQVLAIDPCNARARSNMGLVYHQWRKFEKAIDCFNHAMIAGCPEIIPELRYNRSFTRLSMGDYARGFADYESRLKCERRANRTFDGTQWSGQSLKGKTIFICAEQGFGDTIHFCRYAGIIAAMGADVILEVQPELVDLMCTLTADVGVIARGEVPPKYDYWAWVMSLPFLTGTRLDSIPAEIPYLFADRKKRDMWMGRIDRQGGTKRKVGLVWSSNPFHEKRHGNWVHRQKSFSCETYAPLLDADCAFFGLQKGVAPTLPGVTDCGQDIKDFADTAAIIANLDLLITVDTAAAHLGGAMGKPVWLMNPFNTCWRWGLYGEYTPWYPTVRIFRQERPGEWGPVVERVKQELLNEPDFLRTLS